MLPATPLPQYLVKRYKGWKATVYEENRAWYQRLATEGQRPRTMVVSCCDSRVHVTSLFGAETGEFFIHRNIANLIPPYAPDKDYHGTSAAIEYAVTALKVSNIIVMGHSNCGGVAACHDMVGGQAPELEADTSFVGRWLDILRRGVSEIAETEDRSARLRSLEHRGVIVSLENLMTFPFVETAVADGSLALHGVWNDIETGVLLSLGTDGETFGPV